MTTLVNFLGIIDSIERTANRVTPTVSVDSAKQYAADAFACGYHAAMDRVRLERFGIALALAGVLTAAENKIQSSSLFGAYCQLSLVDMMRTWLSESSETDYQSSLVDLTSETIKKRPMPFVGMPVCFRSTGRWSQVGERDLPEHGCIELWSNGRTSVLLPGEPGCPPLPNNMRVKPGDRYILLRNGEWWESVQGKTPWALRAQEVCGRRIPVPKDYVLRSVSDSGDSPEDKNTSDSNNIDKLTPEMVKNRPMPFTGMPIYRCLWPGWYLVNKETSQGLLQFDELAYWKDHWKKGNAVETLLPGEPGCPPLPVELHAKLGDRCLYLYRGTWCVSSFHSIYSIPFGQYAPRETLIAVPSDYVLRSVSDESKVQK